MKMPGLIAIAGIIGVGKTTLAETLAETLNAVFVKEEYETNPFLAQQLNGDQDAALASELYFLLGRARQLQKNNLNNGKLNICDYLFDKNRIFAQLGLKDDQLEIFYRLEAIVKKQIARPNLVVYMHDSIERCLERIRQRGREYEMAISSGWLARLGESYDNLLDKWTACPVIRVDCGELDVRQMQNVENILRQIRQLAMSPTTT